MVRVRTQGDEPCSVHFNKILPAAEQISFQRKNQCAQLRGGAPASAPSLSCLAFFDTAGTLRRSRIAISRMGTPVPQSFRSVETSCSDQGRVSGGRKKVIVLDLSVRRKVGNLPLVPEYVFYRSRSAEASDQSEAGEQTGNRQNEAGEHVNRGESKSAALVENCNVQRK